MKTEPKANLARRNFLRALGAGAGAAATPVALMSPASADTENNDEKRKARYRGDSDHIKTFYQVNRYPK